MAAVTEFHREKRSQRRQIFTLLFLGWLIGATATILVALVFSGRNPLGMANQAQVMALDELLELLTLLVGIATAVTM